MLPGGDGRLPLAGSGASPLVSDRFTGWDPNPEPLKLTAPLDPFLVQPGMIVVDRFCVIGRVRHAADGWRVSVTDLTRRAGAAPHHRLMLHRVTHNVGDAETTAVREVVAAHQLETRRIVAMHVGPDALTLVTSPADGPALRLPLTDPESAAVIRTLASIVRECHRAGHTGLRYDLRDLRLDGGSVQLASWRHLTRIASGGAEARLADLVALGSTLSGLGTRRAASLLEQLDPTRPDEALNRLIADCGPTPQRPDGLLPPESPFVGRSAELAHLTAQADSARTGMVGWAWLSGPPGIGKSRLLAQAVAEQLSDDQLIVHLAFRTGMPTTGLAILLDAVAGAISRLASAERERLTTRIRRAVGAQLPVVRQASPRLAELLGDIDDSIVEIPLQERFLRHAGALADLIGAIGTPERVLLLYLDDVHLADAGVRAVLWNLLSPGRRHHSSIVVSAPATSGASAPSEPGTEPGPIVLSSRNPTVLPLQPFGMEELGRWLSAVLQVDDATPGARMLHHETGGVPGQAWERLQQWVESGALQVRSDHRLEFQPPTSPGDPRGDTSPLPGDALVLGSCCCVRSEHVGPFWLTEVTGWSPTRVRSAVTELVQAGVLLQQSNGVLSWRDERARERFTAGCRPEVLRAAHAMVASWLESVDPDTTVVQRAWHLELANAPGPDERLAALHLLAGERQLLHANVERAAWHYEAATNRTRDPASRVRARQGFAHATLLQDRVPEALDAYLEAMGQTDAAGAVTLANEAISAFYLRGADASIVRLADHALTRHGAGVPSGWVAAAAQVLVAAGSWLARYLTNRPVTDPVADQLALLHTWLVASLPLTHPWIALSSIVRGPALTALRTSGESARARAWLAPLVSAVAPERALQLLRVADDQSRRDPVHHPVVLHIRGQTELTLGRYQEGQASLQRAVAGFRQAGDLSIGVISLAMAAFYALDREPSSVLIERLDHALATAYRQRNSAILKNLLLTRLWVRVRAGELRGAEIDVELVGVVPGDPLQDVIAESLLARALLHDGRPEEGLSRAMAAAAARARLPMRPPFLDSVQLPVVLGLLALGRGLEAERALRNLDRQALHNPTLQVQLRWCRAQVAAHLGDLATAQQELVAIVSAAGVHGERWTVLSAHRALAALAAGADPAAVAGHRALAAELARSLQERPPASEAPEPTPSRSPVPPGPAAPGDLAAVLVELRATLAPALPGGVPLEISCAAGLVAPEPHDVFELLVVNLVLAARDGAPRALGLQLWVEERDVDSEQAATLIDAGVGRYLLLGIRALGAPLSPPRGALRECRDLGAALGGFLHADAGEQLALYLPSSGVLPGHATPTPVAPVAVHGTAAVLCVDERLGRTLVSELVRLGWAATTLTVGDSIPADATVALVDDALAVDLPACAARVIPVLPRSAGPVAGALRVPFVVGELDALLRRA